MALIQLQFRKNLVTRVQLEFEGQVRNSLRVEFERSRSGLLRWHPLSALQNRH